ncbi:ABC transporter permease subunit [Paenibacillus sp. JTLBN-2024]
MKTFFIALSGAPTALAITVVALLIAAPLGFLGALTRINKIPVLHRLAQIYVSFVRGTPIIVQIFIIYSSVPLLLTSLFAKFHIQADVYKVNPIWYAFIVFSLVHDSDADRGIPFGHQHGQQRAAGGRFVCRINYRPGF